MRVECITGMETLQDSERRRSIGPGNRFGSVRGQALQIKPSECQQGGINLQVEVVVVRREVAKTCGRLARGRESPMSRSFDDGAVREETQEDTGTQTSRGSR